MQKENVNKKGQLKGEIVSKIKFSPDKLICALESSMEIRMRKFWTPTFDPFGTVW